MKKVVLFISIFFLCSFLRVFCFEEKKDNIKVDLLKGLVPVTYEKNKWKIVDEKSNDWHNYNEQKWANAVILKTKKNIGDYLDIDKDIKAMFVYIPRFSYTIGCIKNDCLGYKIEQASDLSYETPGAIDIKFISKDIKENGIGKYNYDNKERKPTNWLTHPGFTIGDTELNGIWVGKFEVSMEKKELVILPNKKALTNKNISDFINLVDKYDTKYINSNIIKNSQWSAVNYLTQSIYGKYGNPSFKNEEKEVFKNNSNELYTGKSSGSIYENFNSKGSYSYNKKYYGSGASTTGNIYGIYDMSGGSWEYVMANYDYNLTNKDGLNKDWLFNNKDYYDCYNEDMFKTDKYLGHSSNEIYNWYSDYVYSPNSNYPWLLRGGRNYFSNNAGIFYALISDGGAYSNYSTRIVLTK